MKKLRVPYELVQHTADFRIKIYGGSLEELFVNGMRGMFSLCEPTKKIPVVNLESKISLEASKSLYLLVDFLSESLYLSDVKDAVYDEVKFDLFSETRLKATLEGHKIEGFKGPEIKAVTYHDASLEEKDGIWQANIVFDI